MKVGTDPCVLSELRTKCPPNSVSHTQSPLSSCVHSRKGLQGNCPLPFTQHQPPSLHLPGIMLLAQVCPGHNGLLCPSDLITGGKYMLGSAGPL